MEQQSLLSVVHDVPPLLSKERADDPDGLWATKQYGDLKEGDRLRAADYVTGCVEVRQLRSVYKLSFTDIVRVNRFKPTAPVVPEITASDEESTGGGSEEKTKARKESSVRLYVFLTKKKAKTRMADLEETAFLLRLDVGTDGCICSGKSLGHFDQGMLQVPNPTEYKGLVIAKRRADAPVTDEPIVYAYARIVPERRPVIASEVVLGLAENKDRANRYAKGAARVKTDQELLKGMRKYSRTAQKAWEAMSIPEDQSIDFEGFKLAFDELNLVVMEGRALRLFKACDLGGGGTIGISELEVALMMNDAIPTTSYITPSDSFCTFDLDGGGDISWVEFKEAAEMIAEGRLTEPQVKELFDKVDADQSGVIEYEEFKQAWLEMVDLNKEIKARGRKPAFGPMSATRNRRLLSKVIEDEDTEITEAFQVARSRVDAVRKKARLLRDERRKKKAARGGKATLADTNEDATRKRQRRLMVQKEQAERSRQRLEQKVKENELRQQLAAKKDRDTSAVKQRVIQQEKDRIAGIRTRGDDQLWLSRLNLRQIPAKYYEDREWREKLVDVVLLDLQDNRLVELPGGFLSEMVSLRKLNINKNRLSSLGGQHLASLAQLQVLNISRNGLRELPPSVGRLTKLQHLNISKNEIDQLPDEIGGMHALRSLRAHSNNLESLPTSIGSLVSLELCDLCGNRLVSIPNDFSYAIALTSLDISSNRLRHLPLDFGQLFSLQTLDVSYNELASLPTSVSTLKSLKILRIGENAVVEVAEAWGGMTSLVELDAQANRIGKISPSIGDLSLLQKVDFRRNLIDDLPPQIGLLAKLHDVDLRSNRITAVPDEIGALVGLNRLSLAHNRLERRLTDHFGLLTRVTNLDVSNNDIGHLPPSLGALEDLEVLNISRNILSSLPQNFAFLTSLTDLDLSCNRFKDIPTILFGMTALRSLDLTSNVICHLPKEVGALTTLDKLHLRRNLLKSLPLEMVELEKHVPDLNMDQNPLPVLPDKWHVRFGPKEETRRPAGYTSGEVFEWVRAQRLFHDQATEEWEQKAGLYLTGRASAKEFVESVRGRVGDEVWRPYLEPHVLRLFFRAKANGLPDAYQKMSDSEALERQQIASALASKKDEQVRLCAAEDKARGARDWESCSLRTTRARAELAKSRAEHRLDAVQSLGNPMRRDNGIN